MTTFTLLGYRATNPFQLLAEGDTVRISTRDFPTIAFECRDLQHVLREKGLYLSPYTLEPDGRFKTHNVLSAADYVQY